MNILFVGKWDPAGACLSDRFLKEGHDVCWMTGEGTDNLWSSKFKGKIYRGVWKREDYFNIIKSNAIDSVVFMTGTLREQYEEHTEYESLMISFTNLLNVLRNYPICQLVYLSSLELDYDGAHTAPLTDLAAGELLCEAYNKAYGLPYLIVRMGCIYGNFHPHTTGIIGNILTRLRENPEITSSYGPEEYVDTILGADAANAIYTMMTNGARGLYRICSGEPVPFEKLYTILGTAANVTPQVTWLHRKKTVDKDFFIKETAATEDFGWIPSCSLAEKGILYLQTTPNDKKTQEPVADSPRLLQRIKTFVTRPKFKQIFETILLFFICEALLTMDTNISDFKYIDFRLMFVVIISALHGMRAGTLAIILACISYAHNLILSDVDISYLLYNIDTWLPFAVYIIPGSIVGYLADKHQDEKESLTEQLSLLTDKYEFLKSIHGETLEIKGNLQRQIITSKHSFGNAYEVAVQLDTLKPEIILLKVIHILEHIMGCPKAAIFLINSNNMEFARLKACSRLLRDQLTNSIRLSDYPKLFESFEEERLFINKELLEYYPDYAAPIYYKNTIFGFIALYDIGADKFRTYYQNLFKVITSLIEKNLVKALEHESAIQDTLYYPDTELLYPPVLEERIRIMEEAKESISYDYVIGKIYAPRLMAQNEVARLIASVIRGNDCMGVDYNGDYQVILVNMTLDHVDSVTERFAQKGLILEVEQ